METFIDYEKFCKTSSASTSCYNYDYTKFSKPLPRYVDDNTIDILNAMCSTRMTAKEKADTIVKKIIVNGPATIVFWGDGSKTVVKVSGEAFDIEKAFAMAFIKRVCQNNGFYIEIIHKILNNNNLDWDLGHSEGDK